MQRPVMRLVGCSAANEDQEFERNCPSIVDNRHQLGRKMARGFISRSAGYGAHGQGKSGPKLAGTSLSEDDIVNVLTKGGWSKAPHTKPYKGANGPNAKQVAASVKTLK